MTTEQSAQALDRARADGEAAGFARGIEAAAQRIGKPRNFKLNDGRSDIGNAARAKAADEIRALAPTDAAAVPRAMLERLVAAGRDGYGHTKTGERAKECDGCAVLQEVEALLERA